MNSAFVPDQVAFLTETLLAEVTDEALLALVNGTFVPFQMDFFDRIAYRKRGNQTPRAAAWSPAARLGLALVLPSILD